MLLCNPFRDKPDLLDAWIASTFVIKVPEGGTLPCTSLSHDYLVEIFYWFLVVVIFTNSLFLWKQRPGGVNFLLQKKLSKKNSYCKLLLVIGCILLNTSLVINASIH
jgi:hypothetical protein